MAETIGVKVKSQIKVKIIKRARAKYRAEIDYS